jgi:hypothetical protein
MSNRLGLELSEPDEDGIRMAIVRVDGRPLVELIREIELPIATAAGEPAVAGAYGYLPEAVALPPSRHLFGEPARSSPLDDGRVAILGCGDCGIIGCWPLMARITLGPTTVTWDDFRQPFRKGWRYPAALRFVFDRSQYEQVLAGRAP